MWSCGCSFTTFFLFLGTCSWTWVPGYLGNQGTGSLVPWFPLYGSREPQGGTLGEPGNRFPGTGSLVPGNHRGTTGGTTREPGNWFPEPVPWFPPYGSREPVPGSPVPGSEMTGSPKFWFQYEYFPIFLGAFFSYSVTSWQGHHVKNTSKTKYPSETYLSQNQLYFNKILKIKTPQKNTSFFFLPHPRPPLPSNNQTIL